MNKLAVLTSTTATLYSTSDSFNQTDRKRFTLDDNMERSARAWNRALNVICIKYDLSENDYLMYGISRGAQWAHRLALREPHRFLALHAHVNSSYEEPIAQGKIVLWLITTGDREYGYPAARIFYDKCRALGYPILFKSQGNLGHSSSPEIERLGISFFEYALQLKQERYRLVAEKQQDEFAPHEIPKKGFSAAGHKEFLRLAVCGGPLERGYLSRGAGVANPGKIARSHPDAGNSEGMGLRTNGLNDGLVGFIAKTGFGIG
jgi:hypothetical protein